jgi:predicted nucleotidyltransferase
MSRINDLIINVGQYLAEHDIEYVIVGGFANNIYGVIRSTSDIDILVRIAPKNASMFVQFLLDMDMKADRDDLEIALNEKNHFSAVDKKTMFRLDIKGICTEMDKRTLKNRRSIDYQGTKIFFASPEDTIANKLFFGNPQDILDAEGIYLRQYPSLDMSRLQQTCDLLKVRRKFELMCKRLAPELVKGSGQL